jgi:O-antigen/teichoic acid export membrane protein
MRQRSKDERRLDNRGTGLIVAATAFGALAVLIFQAVASRTLGTDGFAPIAVLWTVMFLLYTVLQLPAEQHLTRALVVTREREQIATVRRAMLIAFSTALVIGVGFTIATLDRFYGGSPVYIVITALIVVTRSVMATARGTLAGHRRFAGYGASIGLEAGALLLGGSLVAMLRGDAVMFAVVMALAPLATLFARPFTRSGHASGHHVVDAQSGAFLAWLIAATAASQVIIAGGPIAVSFVGGSATAVSIFFTSFALLRGPVTSAYNLVARVLPDFTELAHGEDPTRLWGWARRITIAGLIVAVFGAAGSGLLLRPIVGAIYGEAFEPPVLAAALGGAGVGLGLGALFATQVYSAAALGSRLAFGWFVGLVVSISVLVLVEIEPVSRVALAFAAGEGTGLVMLGLVLTIGAQVRAHRIGSVDG